MRDLNQILMLYKAEKGIYSDKALAASLGVTATALSNYKSGERRIPDMAMVRLADTTSIPLSEVIAAVNINLKSTSEFEREFWIERVVCVAAGVILSVGMMATPEKANAAAHLGNSGTSSTVYTSWEVSRRVRLVVLAVLRSLFSRSWSVAPC